MTEFLTLGMEGFLVKPHGGCNPPIFNPYFNLGFFSIQDPPSAPLLALAHQRNKYRKSQSWRLGRLAPFYRSAAKLPMRVISSMDGMSGHFDCGHKSLFFCGGITKGDPNRQISGVFDTVEEDGGNIWGHNIALDPMQWWIAEEYEDMMGRILAPLLADVVAASIWPLLMDGDALQNSQKCSTLHCVCISWMLYVDRQAQWMRGMLAWRENHSSGYDSSSCNSLYMSSSDDDDVEVDSDGCVEGALSAIVYLGFSMLDSQVQYNVQRILAFTVNLAQYNKEWSFVSSTPCGQSHVHAVSLL